MTGRGIKFGAWAMGALCVCAALAQGAAGATSGTTAFTCAAVNEGAQFKDAHCKEGKTIGGVGFSHKAFTGETDVTLTNAGTGPGTTTAEPTFLHVVLGGVEFEFKSTEVIGSGHLLNSLSAEVHKATLGYLIIERGVTVIKPAGKGCTVKKSEIATKDLAAETVSGPTPGLKFGPKTGTTIGEITVEGCTITGLNKTYPITGSFIATPEGATTDLFREGTTSQGTLFVGGGKAGLAGKWTIKGPSGSGISFTEVPFATG